MSDEHEYQYLASDLGHETVKWRASFKIQVAVDKETGFCAMRCQFPGCSWNQIFKSFEVAEFRLHQHAKNIHGITLEGDIRPC